MVSDILLQDAGLKLAPAAIGRLTRDLAIRGVRQFYARLRREGRDLQEFLELSDFEFAELCRNVEDIIGDRYPEDLQPREHPAVHKQGVAVHRMHDPERPRYDSSEGE
jgi:hypothetical protein